MMLRNLSLFKQRKIHGKVVQEVLGIYFSVEKVSRLNLTVAAVKPVETPEASSWCDSLAYWIADGILKLSSVLLPIFI